MPEVLALPSALAERLRGVRSVGAITGAGVSAESGIRTYRGAGGIYDDPVEGERTVEALTGETLRRDPDRTWRKVGELARMAAGARPNAAHLALAAMESKVERFVLLTQNVDGLHREAGSRNVIAIHGDIRATVCMACGAQGWMEREELPRIEGAPRCKPCGGVLRPGAVLFGELLPVEKVQRLYAEFLLDPPDLVLVVGTSALFPYIEAPVLVARLRGNLTVEVNPEPTGLSAAVDFSLRGPAGAWVPLLVEALPAAAA